MSERTGPDSRVCSTDIMSFHSSSAKKTYSWFKTVLLVQLRAPVLLILSRTLDSRTLDAHTFHSHTLDSAPYS